MTNDKGGDGSGIASSKQNRPRQCTTMTTNDDGLTIYEQIRNDEGVYFVKFNVLDEKWELVKEFYISGYKHVPVEDGLLDNNFIKLPSEPLEYGGEEDLIDAIVQFINKWGDLDDVDAKLAGMYGLLTWVYDECPCMPLLDFRGPAGSGKTRLGDIAINISYIGMRASGNASFSSLFRAVERWKGTLFINESDMKTSNETSEMIKYLNQRYEYEGGVWRTNKDSLKDESFRAFGPTILTTRQPFQDDALESRCIHIITKETTRDDIPLNLPPEFYLEATVLRNKLLMFRLRNLTGFRIDHNLRFQGVSSRMNQILQPLGSLAKELSPQFYGMVKRMAKELHQRQVRAASNSLDGLIVQAFFDLHADPFMDKERINATEIASMINLDGNRYQASVIGKRLTALGFARKKSTDGRSRYYVIDDDTRDNLQRQFIPDDIDDTESTDTSDSTDSNSGTDNLTSQFDSIRELKELLRVQSYTMLDLESLDNKQGGIAELAQRLLSRGELYTISDGVLKPK